MIKRFVHDKRGFAAVTVIAIVLICATFAAWLVTSPIIGMLTTTLGSLTTDTRVHNYYTLANNVLGWTLLGEILMYGIWWLANAFRREDQTYPSY